MRATSEPQAAAYAAGSVPPVEEIRDGVFALPVPMSVPALPYSYCYAIESGDGQLHLVDTGVDTDENWSHLLGSLKSIGHSVTDVETVTITHLHIDHAGLAARIRSASGARIRMHTVDDRAWRMGATFAPEDTIQQTLDRWAVPAIYREEISKAALRRVAVDSSAQVDDRLDHDDVLVAGTRSLRVIHVPGHTPGHIALAMASENIVFSGDHLLPMMFSGIGLGGRSQGDNPVGDYFRSLKKMSDLGDYEVLPGHGFRFVGLVERCATTLEHHARRAAEIGHLLASDMAQPVWAVAAQVRWTGGWKELRGTHLFSALSQTEMHMENLRSGRLIGS